MAALRNDWKMAKQGVMRVTSAIPANEKKVKNKKITQNNKLD